ncbi:hypothetical protein BDZ89DRAFT_1075171 [Hymenopellis radicata]|nr:hypothetical protein BDZ89DRAFT_1075171 [Hymenopellis radicata]
MAEEQNETHPQPFLPRLSSLSVELMHHADPRYVPYFGPEGAFPRIMQSRWRGNRPLGVAQLESCKIVLTAAHLEKATWHVLNTYTEVAPLKALIADGMKLSIRIISDLVQQFGKNTVLEIPMARTRR